MTRRRDTVLGLLSLAVAVAAFAVSVVAWQRPLPADPRAVPSFQDGKKPRVITPDKRGRVFFDFLSDHEGRLIRIVAELEGVPVVADDQNAISGDLLLLPGPDCPADVPIPENGDDVDTDSCNWLALEVAGEAEGSPGLYFDKGGWYLEGYFANSGYLNTSAGVDRYRIDAVSLVDAVT